MTVNVTVTLTETTGDPLVGARVQAKLFVPDVATDFSVPESFEVEGVTNSSGVCVLAVWPNSSNTDVATYYRFRAWHPTTKEKKLDVCAYVDTAANLSDIAYNCRNASGDTAGSASESAALATHISSSSDPHESAMYVTAQGKGLRQHFGAVGNGVDDDATAVRNAVRWLIATGGVLRVEAGRYLLNSAIQETVSITEQSLSIIGEGVDVSCFVVNNTTGGILLTATGSTTSLHLRELWFACNMEGAGIAVEYSQTAQIGPRNRRMFTVVNCSFRPLVQASANYFTTSIKVTGFYRPLIHNVVSWTGGTATGIPPVIVSVDNCYSPNISDSYFNGRATVGVSSVGQREEGFWFTKNVVNGSETGLLLRRSGREPHCSITGNHFNCRRAGVTLDGVKYVQVMDNLMYCSPFDSGVDNANQPVEYADFNLIDVDGVLFSSNSFRQPNNLKRWHYYMVPGGIDESGVAKTSPRAKHIQIRESGFFAALGAAYSPVRIGGAAPDGSTPRDIEVDFPAVMPTTDFIDYPGPLFSVDDGLSNVRIYTVNKRTTFTSSSAADESIQYQRSITPAVNDAINQSRSNGNNDALSEVTYAIARTVLKSVTESSEAAQLEWFAAIAGVLTKSLTVGDGVVSGGATGGPKGVGTFNGTAFYANGAAGATGSFTTTDGKTVTVTSGIVTGIA